MIQLRMMWRRLTEPIVTLDDTEHYQQAKIIASLSLAVLIIAMMGIMVTLPSYTPSQIKGLLPVIGGIALFFIPYAQSRRGHIRGSSILLASIATILIYGATLSIGGIIGRDILHYYILVTIFTSVFLGKRYTLIFLLVTVLLSLHFVVLNPILPIVDAIRGPIAFTLFGTAFVSAFIGISQKHELDKQNLIKEREQHAAQLLIKQKQYSVLRQFVSAISHDLRTRLSMIETNSFFIRRLMQDNPNVEKAEARLDKIKAIVYDIDEQIRNLEKVLNLANPNSQKVYLNDLLNSIVKVYETRLVERSISLDIHNRSPSNVVYCDPDHLFVAIKNLLDNAIAHSPDDSTVTLNMVSDDNMLIIKIIDEGDGIPADSLTHIFDIFYKVDSARTISQGGLGLGLTIVKMIADVYGGQVTASSTLEQGSEFTLVLPIVRTT